MHEMRVKCGPGMLDSITNCKNAAVLSTEGQYFSIPLDIRLLELCFRLKFRRLFSSEQHRATYYGACLVTFNNTRHATAMHPFLYLKEHCEAFLCNFV